MLRDTALSFGAALLFDFGAALLFDYVKSPAGVPYSPDLVKVTQRAIVSFVLWEALIFLVE